MGNEMKPWRCRGCGAHLGRVVRNGSGVRQLLLYRDAVIPGGAEVDVMAIVEGYVSDVVCSECETVRTWVPGEDAVRALVERCRR